MNRSELATIVEFNAWANRRVFAKVGRLPPRDLDGPAPLSYPSPISTLVHILDTQWYWREGAQVGRLPLEALHPSGFPSLASLRRRWDEEDRLLLEFVESKTNREIARPVTYTWPRARPRTSILWHIIVHIVSHATQHRSELATYLTMKNLSPGNLDFLRFIRHDTRSPG
jgi:uncharacterized damage-inducible protein DinB